MLFQDVDSFSSGACNCLSGAVPNRFPLVFRSGGFFPLGLVLLSLALSVTGPDLGTAQETDVSGVWDLSVEVGGGTATPKVELRQQGETLRGTYEGRMGTSALEGSVRGTSIQFSVTLKFQDQPVEVTYSGIVKGEYMEGTVRFGERATGRWSAKKRRG